MTTPSERLREIVTLAESNADDLSSCDMTQAANDLGAIAYHAERVINEGLGVKGSASDLHPDLVPPVVATEVFNLGRNNIYNWTARGRLKTHTVYGKDWVRLSEVKALCFDPRGEQHQQKNQALSMSARPAGSVYDELREELNNFYNHLRDEGKNLDDLGLQVVDEAFWDLLLLD